MNRHKKHFRTFSNNNGNITIILCVAVLIVVLGVSLFLKSNDKSKREVDFSNVILPETTEKKYSSDLRIAVAAMISPKTTKKYYEELLEIIAAKVGMGVDFSQRKTYAEVNDMVENRDIDLAFVCSGPYVTAHKKFGMEIIAVPVAHGEKVYYSYILANKNSNINSLEDLRQKKFAFTDPHSNTGCLVPRYMLAQKKETPESYFSEFFFSYSHDNSIKAVAEGLADGAAVDHLIWEFMDSVDPQFTSKTKIIQKSVPYGIPPVVVHPDLSPELKNKLRDIFLTIHLDEKAVPVLKKLQIDRFETIDDSRYDSVRVMEDWLGHNEDN